MNENGTCCFLSMWLIFYNSDLSQALLPRKHVKWRCMDLGKREKKIHMPVYLCYTQGMWISLCADVRSSQMMIQLTGVSRAYLTVPRVGESWTPIASSAATQTKLAVSNETGGLGAVTVTGVPDIWKWDPDPHARIEKEDWEGPGGWRSEKGGRMERRREA